MLISQRQPTLPGEILFEHYMQPRRVSVTALAEALGCSRKHMSNVIHGKARIEASLASKLAKVLGTTPHLWLNLQNTMDLYLAEKEAWQPRQQFIATEQTSL